MKKKFSWVVGALVLTLLAVGVFGTTSAFADDGTPPPGWPDGKRGLDGAALEAVADVLDMSTDELSAALEDGQRLNELAEKAGVEMQEIFDALKIVREEAMRERIAQALEDGSMTQEKADWLLEGLDKGFMGGKGFGGRGGGRFQKPDGSAPPDVSF